MFSKRDKQAAARAKELERQSSERGAREVAAARLDAAEKALRDNPDSEIAQAAVEQARRNIR